MPFKVPLKHKFHAKSCEEDGKKFPSKLEREYYRQLKIMQAAGEVLFFLRQVPFDLPGNVKHIVDFQVFFCNGSVEFIDTKGVDTPIGKAKRKMVEDLYPITIKLIHRA